MKVWAVAVGIILLLVTPVLLASYNTAYGTVSTTAGPWPQNPNAWECSANFSANEIILAQLSPNMFWFNDTRAFDMLDDGTPIMYVDINITDPENGVSQYELWYTYDVTNPSRYGLYNATMLYAAPGINQTLHLAPNFNAANGLILGAAEYNGTYLANMTFVGYAINFRADEPQFPPASFVLNYAVTTLQKSYPYTNLIYVNFLTIPASVVFLVYGLKKPRQISKTSKRDMRLPRSRQKNSTH